MPIFLYEMLMFEVKLLEYIYQHQGRVLPFLFMLKVVYVYPHAAASFYPSLTEFFWSIILLVYIYDPQCKSDTPGWLMHFRAEGKKGSGDSRNLRLPFLSADGHLLPHLVAL